MRQKLLWSSYCGPAEGLPSRHGRLICIKKLCRPFIQSGDTASFIFNGIAGNSERKRIFSVFAANSRLFKYASGPSATVKQTRIE